MRCRAGGPREGEDTGHGKVQLIVWGPRRGGGGGGRTGGFGVGSQRKLRGRGFMGRGKGRRGKPLPLRMHPHHLIPYATPYCCVCLNSLWALPHVIDHVGNVYMIYMIYFATTAASVVCGPIPVELKHNSRRANQTRRIFTLCRVESVL